MAQGFELKLINFQFALIKITLSVRFPSETLCLQAAGLAKGHARSRSKFVVTSVRSRFPNTSSIFSEKGTEVSITVSVGNGTVCPKAKNVVRQHKTARVSLVFKVIGLRAKNIVLKNLRNIKTKTAFGDANGVHSYFVSDREFKGSFNCA